MNKLTIHQKRIKKIRTALRSLIQSLQKTTKKSFLKKHTNQYKNQSQTENKEPLFKNLRAISFSGTLSTKDQTFFAKRLSFLIRSGVPVLESLYMIKEQTRSKNHITIIDTLINDVSNGQFLSSSLARSKKLFDDFAINIIRIGETTGILSENLDYLAEELKKKQALRRKVIGAFVYPFIVSCATLGITTFLIVYLFPKIMPVFLSLHVKLPITTRIVIWISNFLRADGLYFFLGIIVVISSVLIAKKKSKKVQFYIDRNLLRIPIIGNILQYYNLANGNRTLGLLLRSGVTLSESLSITGDTAGNLAYQKEYYALMEAVNRGEKLSSYLRTQRSMFPDVLTQIIEVGERSGDLQNSLIYLAQFYENEVDDFTKNLSNMVEPVLMICMGISVGFIAISIITPIYGITQNLHP